MASLKTTFATCALERTDKKNSKSDVEDVMQQDVLSITELNANNGTIVDVN